MLLQIIGVKASPAIPSDPAVETHETLLDLCLDVKKHTLHLIRGIPDPRAASSQFGLKLFPDLLNPPFRGRGKLDLPLSDQAAGFKNIFENLPVHILGNRNLKDME